MVYGHALTHFEIGDIPVLGDFLRFFMGVPLFFTLSGFLIWQSIGRSKTFGEYCKKRFWRIYPELWVAVIVELIVLLLLYHQPINWPQFGMFAVTQSTIFQFWTPDCLRGYGCGCPNGALWTICVLIQFYIVAYPAYKLLHGKKNWIWICTIVAFIALGAATETIRSHMPTMVGKLYGQTFIPYFWLFIMAAFVAEKKEKVIPFVTKWWWALVILCLLKKYLHVPDISIPYFYPLIGSTLLFFAALGIGYALPKLNVKTDISYGIYIYHMTVVNAMLTFGLMHNQWYFAIALAVTCLLAWVSTKTIGEWSRKRKLRA